VSDIYTFTPFPKLARFNREIVVSEKIDGTNAQVCVAPVPSDYDPDSVANLGIHVRNGLLIRAGSRNRWIRPGDDNYGFAAWVRDNADELTKLGVGSHFGEWWGQGIQRNYGLKEKRFSLFNVARWVTSQPSPTVPGVFQVEKDAELGETLIPGPACCHVVPILWRSEMAKFDCQRLLSALSQGGSLAAPGFDNPEGIVIYHTASEQLFKATCQNDDKRKSDLTSV
jgi:hypothetical protein